MSSKISNLLSNTSSTYSTYTEYSILSDIRNKNFKIIIGKDKEIKPDDLVNYRVTIHGNQVDFKFPAYEKFYFNTPFDTKDKEYRLQNIKMYDLKNSLVNINKCVVITNSDDLSYDFRNFILNINYSTNNKDIIPNIELKPVPKPQSMKKKGNKKDDNKKDDKKDDKKNNIQNEKIELVLDSAAETNIETSEDLSKTNIGYLIWYLKLKSNNRNLNEEDIEDFKSKLKLYDQNYLYESIFVDPSNYSSNAIAILLLCAPFFYSYPRFYNMSSSLMIVGIIGFLMCMNILQTKYSVILKNKQISNIYVGSVVLFYVIFFILFNKLNHLVLFFLSGAIVFMLMNYILRIIISNPEKKFGFKRLEYNSENSTFTIFNQRIEKVCDELRKRYKLNMTSKQLYSYITSYQIVEKTNKFVTTEFICNIIQPIVGVIILYLMGGILNKAKNYTILKSEKQLLQENLLKSQNSKLNFQQDEYTFFTSPIIGFTELSNKVISNQYNYFLPKELNLHYVMEQIIDEVNDKIIKTKSAHVYDKTILNEKIVKNLDKYMRRFLRFIQDEYLPVCIKNKDESMNIQTLRKDNRYNMFDGTYNKVHDVLEKYELMYFNTSNIEDYYNSMIQDLPKNKKETFIKMIQDVCKDYVYHHQGKSDDFVKKMNDQFYTYLYELKLGADYTKQMSIKEGYLSQMDHIMKEITKVKDEINQYESTIKLLSDQDSKKQQYVSTYENKKSEYQSLLQNYGSIQKSYNSIEKIFESIRVEYEDKINSTRGQLKSYIESLHIEFKSNLFVTLIQFIEENNKIVDLDERNNAMNSIKYKFKDIYDFITNEELFNEKEQNTLINIIEDKISKLLNTIYESSIKYNRNNIILGNITPEPLKELGASCLKYIIQPISSWILLGKMVGSGWYGGKMAMSDISKSYEDVIRNFEYDGHFSSIWKICSMGIDRMYHEDKISEHRELLVNKMKNMNPVSRVFHYVGSFFFFILFGILLNAYNNMVFGMSMYPLWTNLPALIILFIILVIIYFVRK